ncbi:MAG TPA: hypothetical protein VMG82_38170 [Candidatus Sulfotelmatobacter sp.]|nr:hypothetical protein [Candidatus Sulfotelmatobacter sp.]
MGSLPPRDSPLTKVFLGQFVSSLMQETITCLKVPYDKLAQEMSTPELVLRDAVQGKLGFTRPQWNKLAQSLNLPTTFTVRPSEREGKPCWELCYPPVQMK